MVIIVEGIDRIGKTTLCKELSEKLNIPIYKEDKAWERTQEGNRRSQMSLLNLCRVTNCNVIFDRLFTSEYIYGMIDRKNDEAKSRDIFWESLAECLKIKNVVYIGMNPTNIEKSSSEHGADLLKHVQCFSEANKIVRKHLEEKHCGLYIEGKYADISEIVKEVIKYAKCADTINNKV